MPDRWLDVDWSALPRTRDPDLAAWTAATLARIDEGGREQEVAEHRARMAACTAARGAAGSDLFVAGRCVSIVGGQ